MRSTRKKQNHLICENCAWKFMDTTMHERASVCINWNRRFQAMTFICIPSYLFGNGPMVYSETADGTIEFLRFDRFQLCFEMFFASNAQFSQLLLFMHFWQFFSNFLPLRWACFKFRPLVEVSDQASNFSLILFIEIVYITDCTAFALLFAS